MTIQTDNAVRALVGYGANNVGLYLIADGDDGASFLKRNCVLEMPRDGNRREDDENVQYVRRIADAINETAEFVFGRDAVLS